MNSVKEQVWHQVRGQVIHKVGDQVRLRGWRLSRNQY